jgi:hypothetical protein
MNSISAPSPQTIGGTTYTWTSWSDGGAQTHNVVAGSSPVTYAATFAATAPSFPIVESVTTTSFPTDSTSHLVQMPATVNAGDLLIAFTVFDDRPNVNTPAGWTFFFGWGCCPDEPKFSMHAKRATGTEGGTTVDFVTTDAGFGFGAAQKGAAQVYRITGWRDSGILTNDIAWANDCCYDGATANPDSPALNPTHWDVENTLWIAAYGADDDHDGTAYPTNYAGGTFTESDSSATSASMGSAWRHFAAVSEDPGTFTIAASAVWIASTVAVRPAVS